MTNSFPVEPDWYKDAIIYELHLKAFFDANGDGIGDIRGLIKKLDYIQDLGVTAIWLLPFYPSPLRDDGYDIADYRGIHESYGTLADFRILVRETHRRGMRVIIELVVNHTSDQHRWFQRARHARAGTSTRDLFVWSETEEKYKDARIIFTDTEKSNWAWDPVASAFYWHRFFSHQPDLNYDNPRVMRLVLNTIRFWLDLGVDGFRLDAIPYLCERDGTSCENLPETHAVIKRFRAELDCDYPGRMLLAEANQWPEDVKDYFGDGDECHMAFHFPLMPRFYMAIATEDRHPITDILRQTPEIPDNCQWAIFLRNHDELTLEMVTDAERDYLWVTYAADRRARLNLGIRRRLAPLMDNDRRKIQLMNVLLLSMPGTPIIYYGDEIGMGDNIFLGDRGSVRTPMQWTPDRNGGFSRADPARLYLPPIMDAVYGYQALNVEAQSRNLASLLNWMKRLIAVRKSLTVFGRGSLTFLYPANRAVIAYLRQHGDVTVLCVINLSRSAQAAELDLSGFVGDVPVELMGRSAFPVIGEGSYVITLQGYGYYWFQLMRSSEVRKPVSQLVPDLVTLVQMVELRSVFEGRNRLIFEREVLPAYLSAQRWFVQKGERQIKPRIAQSLSFTLSGRERCWLMVEASGRTAVTTYALSLIDEWQVTPPPRATTVLAKLRRRHREGYLIEAFAEEEFIRAMIDAVLAGATVPTPTGTLLFRPTPALLATQGYEKPAIRPSGPEHADPFALVENWLVIKFYRLAPAGTHPEIEMGAFLAQAGFANAPRLYGSIHLRDPEGTETALAVLHAFVGNQGDGWNHALAYLDRFLQDIRAETSVETVAPALVPPPEPRDLHAAYLVHIEQLARRTAEFHRLLHVEAGDPAFAVEPAPPGTVREWAREGAGRLDAVIDRLNAARGQLQPDALAVVDAFDAHRREVVGRLLSLPDGEPGILLSRCHGDFHLGRIFVAQNDAYLAGLGGPSSLPLEERRRKHSILRDVASMLRSFDDAAWRALDQAIDAQPNRHHELYQAVALWRDEVAATFLRTYLAAIGDCPLWPQNPDMADRLLTLFRVMKAIAAVEEELGNRPGRAGVPLADLKSLLLGRSPAAVSGTAEAAGPSHQETSAEGLSVDSGE